MTQKRVPRRISRANGTAARTAPLLGIRGPKSRAAWASEGQKCARLGPAMAQKRVPRRISHANGTAARTAPLLGIRGPKVRVSGQAFGLASVLMRRNRTVPHGAQTAVVTTTKVFAPNAGAYGAAQKSNTFVVPPQ